MFNITDGSQALVTGIVTDTNENDSITGTLSGGTDDDWNRARRFIDQRRRWIARNDDAVDDHAERASDSVRQIN